MKRKQQQADLDRARLLKGGLVTVAQACAILAVGKTKMFGLLDSAGGPVASVMIEGGRRVFKESLADYVEACLEGRAEPSPRFRRQLAGRA